MHGWGDSFGCVARREKVGEIDINGEVEGFPRMMTCVVRAQCVI